MSIKMDSFQSCVLWNYCLCNFTQLIYSFLFPVSIGGLTSLNGVKSSCRCWHDSLKKWGRFAWVHFVLNIILLTQYTAAILCTRGTRKGNCEGKKGEAESPWTLSVCLSEGESEFLSCWSPHHSGLGTDERTEGRKLSEGSSWWVMNGRDASQLTGSRSCGTSFNTFYIWERRSAAPP